MATGRTGYIAWLRDRVGSAPVQLNFAAGLVCHGRTVLLQRRGDDGTWGIPGGAIELDESAEDATVRELFEETGLDVRVTSLVGVYTKYRHTYPNGDVAQPITIVFRCEPAAGTLRIDGCETLALGWHPIERPPPMGNAVHRDAIADLAAGRHATFR